MKYTFLLAPVPASRPRVTRWGTYYGKKYTKYRKAMEKMLSQKKYHPYPDPLFLDVTFFIEIPKSYSKVKRQALNLTPCVSVMDLDNLEKALYDSMTGHIYVDDKQIVAHVVRKVWVLENPRTEVEVSSMQHYINDSIANNGKGFSQCTASSNYLRRGESRSEAGCRAANQKVPKGG